jgi:hypothetical protein
MTMPTHQPDEGVFKSAQAEDIDWEPFAAFPPSARLDRVCTVISGVFYTGLGEQFEEEKLQAYPPGAVVVLPGGTRHFHWAKSAQVTAAGPISPEYVDPSDDPRNK